MLLSSHLLLLSGERQEFSFLNVDSRVGSCSDAGDSYMPESCEEMDGISREVDLSNAYQYLGASFPLVGLCTEGSKADIGW